MERFDVKRLRSNALSLTEDARDRAEELISRARIMEFIEKKREDDKLKKRLTLLLAAIGAVAAVAAIAYWVYQLVSPDYLEEYDENEDDIIPEA